MTKQSFSRYDTPILVITGIILLGVIGSCIAQGQGGRGIAINDQTSPIPAAKIPEPAIPLLATFDGVLAFTDNGNVLTVDLTTGEQFRYRGLRAMLRPRWDTTGRYIAFGRGNIGVIDATTGDMDRLQINDNSYAPEFLPNQNAVVYTDRTNFYVINLITLERYISSTDLRDISITNPVADPSGATLLFISSHQESAVQHIFRISTLCLKATPGLCRSTQLTDATTVGNLTLRWADFSPDGEQLVVEALDLVDLDSKIYLMNADGTDWRLLHDETGFGVDLQYPTWSPDGEWIAFMRTNTNTNAPYPPGTQSLWVIRPDGSDLTQVIYDFVAFELDWGPGIPADAPTAEAP
jgi:Tol biopolymer transport system component